MARPEPPRMLYSYEFRSYSPDGIAVIYQRNRTTRLMEKRFPIQDYQASVVAVAGPAIPAPSTTAYTAFGTPTPDGTENSKGGSTWLAQSRTAYMDKCIDWETAPYAGMEEFRLYDVSARKPQPATRTFLTPDPLWVMTPGTGSYTYAGHDPINMIDSTGLAGVCVGGIPWHPSAVFTTDYIDDPSTEPTAGPRPKIRRVTVTVTLPGDPDPNKVVRESANGGQDLANAASDATRAGVGEGIMRGSGKLVVGGLMLCQVKIEVRVDNVEHQYLHNYHVHLKATFHPTNLYQTGDPLHT